MMLDLHGGDGRLRSRRFLRRSTPVAGAIALAVLLWTSTAHGQDRTPQEAAAEAFARSDWTTAIENYRVLVERGAVDADLFYNLGTAYAQAGQSGRATWMLLRARRLAPRSKEIKANLEVIAPEGLNSQMAVFPIFPLEALYRLFSLNEWAILAGAATVMAGLLFALVFSFPKGKRQRSSLRRAAAIALGLALIGHVFASVKYYEEAYLRSGIVIAPETYPRSAPSESADSYSFALPPGTFIHVAEGGVQGWVKAIYGGRNEVFIRRDQMEFL